MGVCPGLYDDPHRRSLTGGAHSSSRLAPNDPYPVVPVKNPRLLLACIPGRSGAARSRKRRARASSR
jgi:hypothetical protein